MYIILYIAPSPSPTDLSTQGIVQFVLLTIPRYTMHCCKKKKKRKMKHFSEIRENHRFGGNEQHREHMFSPVFH